MKNNNDCSTSGSPDSSNNVISSSSKQVPPKSVQKSLRQLIAEGRSKAPKRLHKAAINVTLMDPYEAVSNYKNFIQKKTGYIEQESTSHYCIWDNNYPENPERVAWAKRRLEALDLINRCAIIAAQEYSDEVFLKKHSSDLYERLKSVSELSEALLQKESSKWDAIYLTQGTFEKAKLAAEAALTLTLKVAKGDLKNGFALIRPPGHHAMKDAFCGYCVINNVAVAAETAIAEGLATKVLIIDYDVHHGQGTQQMFYDRNDVLYFSIHRFEHGTFWPNLRESDSDYIGEGKGKGFNVNVPLNAIGLGDSDYLAIVLNLLLPLAYEFKPNLVIISAGYDSCLGDEKGEMLVSPHFYGHLVTLLQGLADGKIVVCLEGGYFKESLAEGVACTLKALLGDVCYPLNIHHSPSVHSAVQEVINNVKYFLRDYWECFKLEQLFDYPKQGQIEKRLDLNEDEHVTCLDFRHVVEDVTEYKTVDCYPVQSNKTVEYYLSEIEKLRKEYSQSRVCKNIVGYVYEEVLLDHKPTSDTGKSPPERPERLLEIFNLMDEFGLKERCKKIELSQIDEKNWIDKVHASDYVQKVLNQENLSEKPDWYFNEHTANCVLKCVSSILSLAQSISEDNLQAGIAIVRPPGHHAMSNRGSGFCFINNVVVTAEYLIQQQHYKRLLIIDFDVHHGNGTQEMTYNRPDIMYISIHRYDKNKFFPSSPEANFTYVGDGLGKGYNINIPFNQGSKSDTDYWAVWYKLVLPLAYSFNPEFVIVSAGFDAGVNDPLGGYEVSPEMYGHFIHTLRPLASGRILLALEGGYHLKTTALSMISCIKALLGDHLPLPRFDKKISQDTLTTIRNVVRTHKEKWPLLQVNNKLANFSFTAQQKRRLEDVVRDNNEDAEKLFEEIVCECKSGTQS